MADLIDREKLLKTCDTEEKIIGKDWNYDSLRAAIELAPAVDAEPVRHGRWVFDGFDNCYKCSECKSNAHFTFSNYQVKTNYCPNCGAKMDAKEEDNHAEK